MGASILNHLSTLIQYNGVLKQRRMLHTACIIPNTAPAPHISYFISSMRCEGFSEIPPESNVNPFPIKIIVYTIDVINNMDHKY
uniref:Uncharacterized protein n=1 Tax=Glossina palpalis gambiensis TaxID=67801 RepID=A0A1B0C497_9MUSC